MGSANETKIVLGGKDCAALLDTGSTVSTISSSFYHENFAEITLQPLDEILHIECAGGSLLPYAGFIETSVQVPELGGGETEFLMLVVPDTQYSEKIPVVLGTNVLTALMTDYEHTQGVQFLQKPCLTTPWYLSFRSLTITEREVRKSNGTIATVKCSSMRSTVVPRNGKVMLMGNIDDSKLSVPSAAMVQPTKKTVLSKGVELTPALVYYEQHGQVPVEIANHTDTPIVIPPRAVLCELQRVQVEDSANLPDSDKPKTSDKPEHERKTDAEFLAQFMLSEDTDLGEDETGHVRDLLLAYRDIFSENEFDIGCSYLGEHKIRLTDETPFKQRHRRVPPSMYKEVQEHLQKMLDCEVIRPSESPFASGVVLVRKKDGRLRFCVDYRQLNQRTVRDAYALPRIEETMDYLLGATYFSCLDLRAGYYHIEVDEADKFKTAFTAGPLGFWEFNRLPFGLTNAPATFQRIMEKAMGELHLRECLVYIDDVIVHGASFDEHLARLGRVFQKLRENKLKLNALKCNFFKRQIHYLGHIVSQNGVATDPDKIAKVADWPVPRNVQELREFLGFSGYYRKYVRGFSSIARPITELLGGTGTKKKKKNGKSPRVQAPVWKWGPEQQSAFECLKDKLTTPPILAYADYCQPFELHTDASCDGLGAVLYQKQDGHLRVIAYASRSLSKSERNYPTHKLEFLAVKWAVTDKFQEYLYGNRFTIYTDNNPLTYVLTTAKLDAAGHHWLAALSAYDFEIMYRPGKSNQDADILSRMPKRERMTDSGSDSMSPGPDTIGGEYQTITRDAFNAISQAAVGSSFIESLSLSANIVDDLELDLDATTINYRDWRAAQRDDPVIGPLIPFIGRGERPRVHQHAADPETVQLLREFDRLHMKRGVVYRVTEVNEQERLQLLLPQSYRELALKGVHDDAGHLGRDKSSSLLRDRYYWPGMFKDLEARIRECSRCLHRKTTAPKAPLVSIKTVQPLELVCVDYLTLEMGKGGFQYVLVITDHFTRFAQAVPTRNMTARTTAEALFTQYIVHYGFPQRIHSDQGANFESRLIRELCAIAGIDKSRTTPYHAMGNGMCERFNSTLMNMLGTLETEQKRDWKTHIGPLVHAYNATKHDSTGFSPFYLMFGREPRLPVDVALGNEHLQTEKSYGKFVESLREKLNEAYQIATAEADKASRHQKKMYDRRARDVVLDINDRVLVRRLAFEGRHKLADRWEETPYVVQKQPDASIPVYVVRSEAGGRERTLHRNHLLPIGSIPIPVVGRSEARPQGKVKRVAPKRAEPTLSHEESDDSDEEEYAVIPVLAQPDANSIESDHSEASEEAESEHSVQSGQASEASEESESESESEHSVRSGHTETDETRSEHSAELDQSGHSEHDTTGHSGHDTTSHSGSEHSDVDPEPQEEPDQGLRRSKRETKPPDRFSPSDYTSMKRAQTPEWATKANFLASLAAQPSLERINQQLGQGIVKVVLGV